MVEYNVQQRQPPRIDSADVGTTVDAYATHTLSFRFASSKHFVQKNLIARDKEHHKSNDDGMKMDRERSQG